MAKIKKSVTLSTELIQILGESNFSESLETLAWEGYYAKQRSGETVHYKVMEEIIENSVKEQIGSRFDKLFFLLQKGLEHISEIYLLLKYIFIVKEEFTDKEDFLRAEKVLKEQSKNLISKNFRETDEDVKILLSSLGNTQKGEDDV